MKYGYKWWLYPYGKQPRLAFGGIGFGGQRLFVLPELDLVMVFTGWISFLINQALLRVSPSIVYSKRFLTKSSGSSFGSFNFIDAVGSS